MARTFYDSLGLNEDIELDLSMLDATGAYLYDESRNHSMATMHTAIGTPLWMQRASGRYGIMINQAYPTVNTDQYYDIPAANCTNLNFTTTDYSLAVWFYAADTSDSENIMGKYFLDVSGWEVYLWGVGPPATFILTVRHHHGGTRTSFYSRLWALNEWHLFSCSRIGNTGQHYRDGEPITTTVQVGGLLDPGSSIADDFRIGCRFTEDSDWFKARFHRPRAWSRTLTADQHRLLYRLGYP